MAIALIDESDLRRLIREELSALLGQMRLAQSAADLPPVLTAKEAAKVARISLYKLYEFARRPGFPAIKDGRVLRIPRDAFLAWLGQNSAENDGKPCA
ncbi:helix-turn-helix domain-containing protein [Alicyclobacillus vulcanalis]|uniref:DNA binding domain-containing protein, excisionase family n=1 Tax=Alicyclobacillus vulcanalis TaxID=252246 RepID=A0A1N7MSS8_9BACL|nr:helix-turn-helix domain-containing protein [Alicyclobacillus vulcanalis]SIS89088.1 DNA binding domain-containing protein, excisionase family [Alicyclobacillus vulcanalis]